MVVVEVVEGRPSLLARMLVLTHQAGAGSLSRGGTPVGIPGRLTAKDLPPVLYQDLHHHIAELQREKKKNVFNVVVCIFVNTLKQGQKKKKTRIKNSELNGKTQGFG